MGYRVYYYYENRAGSKNSCYWAEDQAEANAYAEMVRRMFPQYVVEVVSG